ncbi:formyl transferase [Massilia glaciei]|uniref:phosphoribosylglycinamide formyltransferase 1 n=1 Tax=Massilia glaciei TaxID=1524097 RepID=A0A2U2HN59_9BURK|nr:formyl transferase [Massilia glaciei]PWF48937.1 formyl transferase [Massilia glaciei]
MYHGIAAEVEVACVVLENKPSGRTLIERRIKRLGLAKVAGQLLFQVANRLLKPAFQPRVRQLIADYQLVDREAPHAITRKVETVNSPEVIALLRQIGPDAIVVNGTRIISKDVLAAVDAPFINTHMGITPKYRGVHGAYWALANGDPENCGVTVHLVDQGIDTGGVLYQDIIRPQDNDNFNTYPLHQMAKAIPLMRAALEDVRQRRISVKNGVAPSVLWHHPTLIGYLGKWLRKGVK